ncbi:MAG: zf-HC2 domain-containing protein [Polyangia bacterium]
MTQRCRHDDQVLDYVYGELSAAERAEFERHLSTCASCPPQVHSFSRVHSEVRGLPRLEPSAEAMQRMTAVLMQEAAKVKPATGKNGVPADPAAAHGGGKVIEFRPRGLRRILLHPATGVTAVAAAALLFVMFRPPGPDTEVTPPAPAAHPTLTAATAPAKAVDSPGAKQQEGGAPKAEEAAAPEAVAAAPAAPVAAPEKLVGDTGGYAAPADKQRLAERATEPAWAGGKASTRMPVLKDKKKGDSLDGLVMAEAEREVLQKPRAFAVPPSASTPSTGSGASAGEAAKKEAKPAELYADKRDVREQPAAEPNFAQPPPPPAEPAPTTKTPARNDNGSIGSELAARSRQRTVDDLENQALGQAPSTLDSVQRGRYAAGGGLSGPAGSSYGNKAEPAGNTARSAAPTDDEDVGASRNNLGRREPTLADEAPRQLQAVQELLAKGRCPEAHAVLNRIEQATPTVRGLAEARTQYQLRCAPSNQQQLTPFTPQQTVPSQAPVLPAPAPAAAAPSRIPLEAQAPPKPSYRSSASNAELRAKKAAKAAPAKAKAADAKSSDAVY